MVGPKLPGAKQGKDDVVSISKHRPESEDGSENTWRSDSGMSGDDYQESSAGSQHGDEKGHDHGGAHHCKC